MNRRYFLAALALGACTGPDFSYMVPDAPSALRLRPRIGSLFLRTVSLPTHAASEEIHIAGRDGAIRSLGNQLWADDPQRAVTLALTRHLATITGVNAGPDPWPFTSIPDAVLDIRIERMLAAEAGEFALIGQFFLAGDGVELKGAAKAFSIRVPLADPSPQTIANARAMAIRLLAETIAASFARPIA